MPSSGSGTGLIGPASVDAVAQVFVADLAAPSLSPEDSHHLSRVLRLRSGEPVVACDGSGSWRVCRYRKVAAGDGTQLDADGPIVSEPIPTRRVVVGFVPVKGQRPELVVQKLTEVGVDAVVLLSSALQVVRWDQGRVDRAVARLRRVAREAAAQSRRAFVPEVLGVTSLADFEQSVPAGGLALAQPGAPPPVPGTSTIAVGPEGGWEESELLGRQVVGLGPGILRSETAAIVAGYLLGALRQGLVAESTSSPNAP